jgi:hypothetical protein
MRRLYTWWKQGWIVGIRYFWFGCVLGIFCLPLFLLKLCMPGLEEERVFDSEGFHWRVALFFLATVIWVPIALFHTGRFTREFQERGSAEPGAAPNGGPATPSGKSGVTEGPPSVS